MLPSISQTMKSTSPRQNSFNRMGSASQKQQLRRIWVKKNNHTATTIMVGPNDIVDDLKYMIAQKFPTTLALEFDPSDLMIKMPLSSDMTGSSVNASLNENILSNYQIPKRFEDSHSPLSGIGSKINNNTHLQGNRSNTPISPEPMHHVRSGLLITEQHNSSANNINQNSSFAGYLSNNSNNNNNTTNISALPSPKLLVLEPDVLVWSILDKYFSEGMTMSDAFIIDSYRKQTDEPLKKDPRIRNIYNYTHNQTLNGPSLERPELSSTDMGRSGSFNNTSNNNSISISKVAILGDQKVPPPRLKSLNSESPISTPQSSAVILFSKDVRDSSKSPLYPIENVPPPPPSPKIDQTNSVPVPLSRKQSTQSSTIESHRKSNLKVNTDPTSVDKSAEVEKLPNDNHFNALTSTPNTISSNTNNVPIQLNTPSTNSASINQKVKSQNSEKNKDKKKYDMPKILTHINVLVVEDNLVNQKIMARHLKSCNVQFKIASTGKEALEIWKLGGFHLCFMDIQLPVMSGIEVTKEIRRLERLNEIGGISDHNNTYHNNHSSHSINHQHIIDNDDILDLTLFRSPIIIVALTASTGATDQQDALAAGCNDYLTKPVQLKWLKNKLTEWGYMQALINYDYFKTED